MSKKLEFYVYTTPIFQKEGLIKVGHGIEGRYENRVGQKFNAANPGKPTIHWNEKDYSDLRKEGNIIRDKLYQSIAENAGNKND